MSPGNTKWGGILRFFTRRSLAFHPLQSTEKTETKGASSLFRAAGAAGGLLHNYRKYTIPKEFCQNGKRKNAPCWVDAHCAAAYFTGQNRARPYRPYMYGKAVHLAFLPYNMYGQYMYGILPYISRIYAVLTSPKCVFLRNDSAFQISLRLVDIWRSYGNLMLALYRFMK